MESLTLAIIGHCKGNYIKKEGSRQIVNLYKGFCHAITVCTTSWNSGTVVLDFQLGQLSEGTIIWFKFQIMLTVDFKLS